MKNGRIGDWVFVERKDGVDGGIALKEAAARAAAGKKKLFGLFGGPEGYFEPPVPSDNGTAAVTRATIENPLLKDATLAALEVLGRNKKGFFLLVEQGDIDWANHANDYRWMIGTMWDLDEAVRAAVDFVNRPGDDITWENTLLIVTSDHVTGTVRLNDSKRLGRGRLPAQSPGLCPDKPTWCPGYPGGEVGYGSTAHLNDPVIALCHGRQPPDQAPAAIRRQLVPLHAHHRQHPPVPRHDQRRRHPTALRPSRPSSPAPRPARPVNNQIPFFSPHEGLHLRSSPPAKGRGR